MNLVMMSHNLSKFYVQMTCNFSLWHFLQSVESGTACMTDVPLVVA